MKSEWYICRYEKKEFCHWDNTGGIVEHYAKCNTPGTGRQTAHVLTFTGNMKQLKAERAESRTVIGEPKSTKPREKRRGCVFGDLLYNIANTVHESTLYTSKLLE